MKYSLPGAIIPVTRNIQEHEEFYTAFNRFTAEPDYVYNVLKSVVEHFPDQPPTNKLHVAALQLVLKYERGFTARKNNEDVERFSWLLGQKLQPCIELRERLAKQKTYFDSGKLLY